MNACELATYFVPSELSAPGAAQILDDVNGLLANYTNAGWRAMTAVPLGSTKLTLGSGSLDGISVMIIWVKES